VPRRRTRHAPGRRLRALPLLGLVPAALPVFAGAAPPAGASTAMSGAPAPYAAAFVQSVPFEILGRFSVDTAWNGSPLVLRPNENALMRQTPNGSMVFSYLNVSTQNNRGQLALTSGGGAPTFLDADALTTQAGILVGNWRANDLSVTNTSPNLQTPIRIQAIGPGIPGTSPVPLPTDAVGVSLAPGESAQGPAQPRYMQLVVQASGGIRAVAAIIGGPPDASGNNAYVVVVNDSVNSGAGTPTPAPPGYYATTTANAFVLSFNWGGAEVFVANLSASNVPPLTALLRAL
jgi:hypothetical protein